MVRQMDFLDFILITLNHNIAQQLHCSFSTYLGESMKRVLHVALCLAIVLVMSDYGQAQDNPPRDSSRFKNLRFRNVGPAAGGRVSRACGVPGDPLTYYAATASGGVWKSMDGGIRWRPIFDDQPIASIGAIAVAPSDPNVIYVGSGEANIRGNVAAGNGIYKSTDAGKTWRHVWKQEGQIGTIVVHPLHSNIAFAAVLGHAFGPNKERGVYRTKDGGKTWELVLHKNAETGASDVCFDQSNPTILFAGLWQARRRPWEMTSGGPGSGLYVSRDGGDTWKQITTTKADGSPSGLPDGIMGKIGVGVAPSNGNRVYALIEHDKGGLFRSDDGGVSWSLINDHRALRQRAWYYTTLTIHPNNADVVWFPQVSMLKTSDAGRTLQRVRGIHHGDHHDLWMDPKNPDRMIGANDGGVDVSTNGGATWFAPPLPITQFYHVATDNRTPYYISGAAQDLGTFCGPSNSLNFGGINPGDWYYVGGGEAGHTAHHPTDSNIVYAGEYAGIITRYDHRTRQSYNVSVYPTNPSGHGGERLQYRFQWTAPIHISPHDPNTVYHGANVIFKTTDGGATWSPVSGDLTRNDKNKQQWSGGPITGDNTGVEMYCTVFAVTESPAKAGVIWSGSDDGVVQVTLDGGKSWTNVTKNIPEMPEWGTVSIIEASKTEAGTAYLVVDNHRMDDMKPYLWKTTDFGKTWKKLSAKLPQDIYLHVVREDHKKRGMLYLGTERGLMFSHDDGNTWTPLKMNFPTVAVHDLVVKNNDLVVGTHGRSFWVLDDLTAIRELAGGVPNDDIALLPVQNSTRWLYGSNDGEYGSMPNPASGMMMHYWLKAKASSATLEILDANGNFIRSYSNKPEPQPEPALGDYSGGGRGDTLSLMPGLHRFIWDQRYKGAEFIRNARTDGGDPTTGPLAAPGLYTLRLKIDGKTISQSAQLLQDIRQATKPATINDALAFTLSIRDTISSITRFVQQLRTVKRQLEQRNETLSEIEKSNMKAETLIKASKTLIAKCDSVEMKFHNPTAKVSYDILAGKNNTGAQLYSILVQLYDFMKYNDTPIPQGSKDVFATELQKYQTIVREWQTVLSVETEKLNSMAKEAGFPHIFIPPVIKNTREMGTK